MNLKHMAMRLEHKQGRFIAPDAVRRIAIELGIHDPARHNYTMAEFAAIEDRTLSMDAWELDEVPPDKLPSPADIQAAMRTKQAERNWQDRRRGSRL